MKVYMSARFATRLRYFVMRHTTEVGGWGYARLEPESGDIVCSDLFLVPQEVSNGEVDLEVADPKSGMTGDEFAINKMVEDDVHADPQFIPVSWHSHGNTNVFWSGTDDKRIEKIQATGLRGLLSVVANRSADMRFRLDLFGVEHHGMSVPHVKLDNLDAYLDPTDPLYEECEDEIETHVRKKTYVQRTQPSPWTVSPKVLRNGVWTQDGKPCDPPPSRPLTESEQADSAFSIEPTGADSSAAVDAAMLAAGLGSEDETGEYWAWD